MRGKDAGQSEKGQASGITPAYAGKSGSLLVSMYQPGDHPRICGEKHLGKVLLDKCIGSPPHMRGKASTAVWMDTAIGITPAYAGKRPGMADRPALS